MTQANPKIMLLTSLHCSDCERLRGWLTEMRIPFVERQLSGPTGMDHVGPLTIIEDRTIAGPVSEQKRAIFDALAITVLG